MNTALKQDQDHTLVSQCKIIQFPSQNNSTQLIQPSVQPIRKSRVLHVPPSNKHAVDPLLHKEDIDALYNYFLTHKNIRPQHVKQNQGMRNYCMCLVGMYFGLRIGDLLSLTISDMLKSDGSVIDRFWIEEEKTRNKKGGSYREIVFNKEVKDIIELYLEHRSSITPYQLDDYLFESNKKKTENNPSGESRPIDRKSAWKILRDAGDKLGFTERGIKLGTHSLRKTFGAQITKQHPNDPLAIQSLNRIYGHNNVRTTNLYTGITQEGDREIYRNLKIGSSVKEMVGMNLSQ